MFVHIKKVTIYQVSSTHRHSNTHFTWWSVLPSTPAMTHSRWTPRCLGSLACWAKCSRVQVNCTKQGWCEGDCRFFFHSALLKWLNEPWTTISHIHVKSYPIQIAHDFTKRYHNVMLWQNYFCDHSVTLKIINLREHKDTVKCDQWRDELGSVPGRAAHLGRRAPTLNTDSN